MRLALLSNAASGSGATSADRVLAALRAHGAEVDLYDLRDVCRPGGDPAAVLASRPERVAVSGGDGSVGPAAELAARLGVPLAVVPTGTANDFARAMGIPLDVDDACALAARQSPRMRVIDLARAADRPFVNTASTGLSVLAARRAHDLKPRLGPLAYAAGALRAGLSGRPGGVRVTVDGELLYAGDAWQVIVAGTGAFGGGARLDRTRGGDRLLDVAVLEAGPRLALVRRAWGMRAGGLAGQPGVLHTRGRAIEVEGPATFNVDGEVLAVRPPHFEATGEVVQVVVP